MPASRAIPSRLFLPLLLFVPLLLGIYPDLPTPMVSYAEVVSLFDEVDPPRVCRTDVPNPWQDDVFTGSIPSMPCSDDESSRKGRIHRVYIQEKPPAASPVFSRMDWRNPSITLGLLTHSLVIGRPPPRVVPSTG